MPNQAAYKQEMIMHMQIWDPNEPSAPTAIKLNKSYTY